MFAVSVSQGGGGRGVSIAFHFPLGRHVYWSITVLQGGGGRGVSTKHFLFVCLVYLSVNLFFFLERGRFFVKWFPESFERRFEEQGVGYGSNL